MQALEIFPTVSLLNLDDTMPTDKVCMSFFIPIEKLSSLFEGR